MVLKASVTPTDTPAETELDTVASIVESLTALITRSPAVAPVSSEPPLAQARAPPSTVLVAMTRLRPTSPAATSLSSSAFTSEASLARMAMPPAPLAVT